MPEDILTIEMWRGLLEDVKGLPSGWDYEFIDLDSIEGQKYMEEYGKVTSENTVLITVYRGVVDEVINLPPGYDYREIDLEEGREGSAERVQPKQILESKDKRAVPEDRGEIDTFKITFFVSGEGLGVGDYDKDDQGIFFAGTLDEAVEYAKSYLKEELRDKVDLITGYTSYDVYGCDTGYFDPVTGEEITEEEAEALDYEVTTQSEGFNIYWDYPEKEEQVALSSQRKKAAQFKEGDKVKYSPVFWDKFTSDIEPGIIGTVISGGMGWGVHPDPARKYVMVEWEDGNRESTLPDSLEKISSQKKKALDIESLDVESLNIKSLNREDLENLLKDWIGEENLREPLKEWSTGDIIYELEDYQRRLIDSKTIFSSDLSIEKEKGENI